MKLKVCGMKYIDNINAVAQLQPDYLGFIFYEKSSRFFDLEIPEISSDIKKVGVFVNAEIEDVISILKKHQLNAIQLHGNESPDYCKKLKSVCHSECDTERGQSANEASNNDIPTLVETTEIIKVFSIKDNFDFSVLQDYEDACDYFLFDTKGKLPGGNGYTFDWNVLAGYSSTKPFFLSGGIGPNEIKKLKHFERTDAAKYCHAIDVNSKFEIEAGLKNTNELEKFKYELQH